ncbi:MAG: putative membrane protein [uncultured Paraburkholderia sp.]|nr:MAG: putative membrane protein [uncultured Paraburkholderia sp.]CAH2929890.1 MAG: putative membrane protein [uncultured Paraburkholderia sp.]
MKVATTLRIYSQAHQRDESFRLLQRQAELMPTLVDRLQTMMSAMEQHSLAFNERQLASQEAFHSKAQLAYARLAASVEQSLKQSVADSTRAAGEALEPVMQATMAGLARESAALHESVSQAVQRQLDGLSNGFESATAKVAGIWNEALAGQQRSNEALSRQLQASLEHFTETFDERSTGLVDGVSARLEAAAGQVSEAWKEALSRQQQSGETLAARPEKTLAAAAAAFEAHSASLLRTVGQSHADLQSAMASRDEERLATWTAKLESMAATLGKEWQQAGAHNEARLTVWTAKLDALVSSLGETWQKAGENNEQQLAVWTARLDSLATALGKELQQADAHNEERLAVWTAKLDSMAAALSEKWQQAGERTASRQQQICDTLEQTARDISAQTQTHASETIAEISRLVQAASEAPKAAAEVVAELRQKLSDSMVRDTAMLEERSRLLETLETLLDAVNHASTEQRTAVDALVATSADLLDRVGTRFTEKVEAEAQKIGTIAAQITGGAVEVACLSEAFGAAVQMFGESNDKLVAHLERIEAALDKSLARSDEQLAYYVAQAREVVDLSVMSQKQIAKICSGSRPSVPLTESRRHERDERGHRRRRGARHADLGGVRRPDVRAARRVHADSGRRHRRAARTVEQARAGGQTARARNAAPQDARRGARRPARGRPRDARQRTHRHQRQCAVRAELRPVAAARARPAEESCGSAVRLSARERPAADGERLHRRPAAARRQPPFRGQL